MMDIMFDETVLLLQKENAHLLDENFVLLKALKRINEISNKNVQAAELILVIKHLTKDVLHDYQKA